MWTWFKQRYLTTKFLVKINYKSGNSHTGWFYWLVFANGEARWQPLIGTSVMYIGLDHIESVYVLKKSYRLFTIVENRI